MISVQRFLGLLFVIGGVCSGGVADAATYYVSTNGSDGRSCSEAQSQSAPMRTLNNATACLSAGDTLYLRGGVYDESLYVNEYNPRRGGMASGTSWGNKVRIAAFPGDSAVWLRPRSDASSAGGIGYVIWIDFTLSYVEFDGINLDGSNLSGGVLWFSTTNGQNPNHLRFQNAEIIAGQITGAAVGLGAHSRIGASGGHEIINARIHGGGLPGQCGLGCAAYGVYVSGPNNLIDGCDIYDTGGAGVHIYNGSGDGADNNIVRNNRIHDITRTGNPDQVWGIIVVGANNKLYNNVIWGINVGNVNNQQGNAAISLLGATGTEVFNNTIYGNAGWGLVVGPLTLGTVLRNNISYGSGKGNYVDYGLGTSQSNNLFTDPHFVNAGGADFRLRSDSPAIDQGAFLNTYPYDQQGVSRPQGAGYDIGAYEFTGGSSSAPAAPAPPAPPAAPAPPPAGLSPSPDGTRVPGATLVVDAALNVWTLGPGNELLKNGSQAANGYGFAIVAYQGAIYVQGDDYNWWRWTGSTYVYYGGNPPI